MTSPSASWEKNWKLMSTCFTDSEINFIQSAIRQMTVQNVVYCSFENRFAKSGGLAAVTTKILPYLKETAGIPNVVLMTPFYSKISDASKLKDTGIRFLVPYSFYDVEVSLLEYKWEYEFPNQGSVTEYYLKADEYFDASNHINDPYLYIEENPRANNEALQHNALFFCQAAPLALKALGIVENVVLHLQDWQTALLSLTAKQAMLTGVLKSCATVQTMHNAFDTGISWALLADIFSTSQLQKLHKLYDDPPTAFQLGLQFVDGPLNTVSDHFADEFTTDIMQSQHFAPHLQDIFNWNGVYGVNNGMFVDFAPEFANKPRMGIRQIETIKLQKRHALLDVLDNYIPKERFGLLTYKGESIRHLPDDVPILVMSGRLDPVQKGFDILLRAMSQFAEDEIKLVLTPMPVRDSDLDIFRNVASECAGNITVYPIRMQQGFRELQMGSTFGIMPSVYEPFGAAVEYMANGTLNIARATGGLVDQIDNGVNGILFREADTAYTLKYIKKFAYAAENVDERADNPWMKDMVDSLVETLKAAITLYQQHPDSYYRMILNGLKRVREFSWERTAQRYITLFQKVNKGF
ncbi:glycogen/starch synthase [candidate division KSB1 bacterium]|nr:glycogen/starch synthase [candidate division KSB1 bacterium]